MVFFRLSCSLLIFMSFSINCIGSSRDIVPRDIPVNQSGSSNPTSIVAGKVDYTDNSRTTTIIQQNRDSVVRRPDASIKGEYSDVPTGNTYWFERWRAPSWGRSLDRAATEPNSPFIQNGGLEENLARAAIQIRSDREAINKHNLFD